MVNPDMASHLTCSIREDLVEYGNLLLKVPVRGLLKIGTLKVLPGVEDVLVHIQGQCQLFVPLYISITEQFIDINRHEVDACRITLSKAK